MLTGGEGGFYLEQLNILINSNIMPYLTVKKSDALSCRKVKEKESVHHNPAPMKHLNDVVKIYVMDAP